MIADCRISGSQVRGGAAEFHRSRRERRRRIVDGIKHRRGRTAGGVPSPEPSAPVSEASIGLPVVEFARRNFTRGRRIF
jgi:hypothetical protein